MAADQLLCRRWQQFVLPQRSVDWRRLKSEEQLLRHSYTILNNDSPMAKGTFVNIHWDTVTEPEGNICFSTIFRGEFQGLPRGLQNNGLKLNKNTDVIFRMHTRMYAAAVLKISLHVRRSAIKQWNTTKNKFFWKLCFIVVDFIHSCHHRLLSNEYL